MAKVLEKIQQLKTIILLALFLIMLGVDKLGWYDFNNDALLGVLAAAGLTAKFGQNRIETSVADLAKQLTDLSSKLKILIFVPVIVFGMGCSKITMPTKYATSVRHASVVCAELRTRCEAGDAVACKAGCIQGSRALDEIVCGLDACDPNSK